MTPGIRTEAERQAVTFNWVQKYGERAEQVAAKAKCCFAAGVLYMMARAIPNRMSERQFRKLLDEGWLEIARIQHNLAEAKRELVSSGRWPWAEDSGQSLVGPHRRLEANWVDATIAAWKTQSAAAWDNLPENVREAISLYEVDSRPSAAGTIVAFIVTLTGASEIAPTIAGVAAVYAAVELTEAEWRKLLDMEMALRSRLTQDYEPLRYELQDKGIWPFDSTQDRPFDSTQDRPFDSTQDKPFDSTQDRPFDSTQYRPFDSAQDKLKAKG